MLGTLAGVAVGWVVGYFVIIERCSSGPDGTEDLGLLGEAATEIGRAICMNMAPTAPDTILFAVLGALAGLGIAAWRVRGNARAQEGNGNKLTE